MCQVQECVSVSTKLNVIGGESSVAQCVVYGRQERRTEGVQSQCSSQADTCGMMSSGGRNSVISVGVHVAEAWRL
jgi:hypothetical protein